MQTLCVTTDNWKKKNTLTARGNKMEYAYDTTSLSASLIEIKLVWNSVIFYSLIGARYLTSDIWWNLGWY